VDEEKEAYLNTREGQVALRKKVASTMEAAMKPTLKGSSSGSKPAQASVLIDSASTSSPGRVFLVGGVQGSTGGA